MQSPRFPEKIRAKNTVIKIYRNANPLRADGFDYKVAYYDVDGRRRFRSFDNYKDARAEAASVAERAARGEMETLELCRSDLAAWTQAKTLLEPHKLSVDSAVREYVDALKVLGGRYSVLEACRDFAKRNPINAPSKTVSEVVDELLDDKRKSGKSDLYLTDLRYRLRAFAEAFHCRIASVSVDDVKRFRDALELSPRSKNNFGRAIVTLVEFAKGRKYLPKDYDEVNLKALRVTEEQDAIDIFTPGELAKLLKAASGDFVPVLAIAAFSGLRTTEIAKLDWKHINLAGHDGERFIEVTAKSAKTRSRRAVEVPANLVAWLTPHAKPEGPVWGKSLAYLHESQENVAKTCGIDWKHNAMRHSYISYRVAMTKNVNAVALECGNSPQMIFRHYRELVRKSEAEKWFAILPAIPANVTAIPQANAALSGPPTAHYRAG